MIFTTKRLTLRPWNINDAESLYKYFKDPKVGPIAGSPAHTTIEESIEMIKNSLLKEGNFAIVLKGSNNPIGNITLKLDKYRKLNKELTETELSFWLGRPYWGQGIMQEAINEMVNYCFNELNLKTIWCGYFEDNKNCKRLQEKCGFKYDHTIENYYCKRMDETRTVYYSRLDL